MTQLLLLLQDPEVWKTVTIILIVVIIVGEFLAKLFPYDPRP